VNQKVKPAAPKLVKFKTNYSAKTIVQVEVLRETTACVYLAPVGRQIKDKGERREAKISDFAQYHDTWSDAHTYLMRRAESNVKEARRQLELANGHLGNVKGMKPPKEGE